MIEKSITWQGTLGYQSVMPRSLAVVAGDLLEHRTEVTSLIRMRHNLPILDIRNWIHQQLGAKYALTGLFEPPQVRFPCYLKFRFQDAESNMLFKLTWF